MFKQQTTILSATPSLRALLSKYQWQAEPANWLDAAEQQSVKFVVPVPLVGAFSSGKSTLINAVIGSSVLSTNIDPETAVPAEVWHDTAESFTGCLPDGRRISLSREQVRENQVEMLQGGGWVEVALPVPKLAALSHLKLVDMPGWDSGVKAHSAAIDNYAARSLAYGVVVSADEGNLRESIRKALRELAVREMPIFVIVTKADKKLPEEVDAIISQVSSEVAKTIGTPPFMALKVSARKNEVDDFVAALQEIECRAETLFAHNVVRPFVTKLQSLDRHLDTLLNSDDLNSEKITAEIEQLATDMATFSSRLDTETAQLDARVQPVMGRIRQRIESSLTAQLDYLADKALGGGDLQGPLGTTVRLAVEQGMHDEFNPEIERYLGRVVEGLPSNFSPEVSSTFNLAKSSGRGAKDGALTVTPIVALVLPALKFIPQLAIIGPIIVGVVGILERLFRNKNAQKIEAAKQGEEVRSKILQEIIPAVVGQASSALQPLLHEHVAQAKQKITDSVKAQQLSHQAALKALQAKLAEGKSAYAQACVQYSADQTFVKTLISQLEQA